MAKTINCPKCGHEIIVANSFGRKPYNIPLENVLEAFQFSKNNYSAAARLLSKQIGKKISPGFVHSRIKKLEGASE